MTQRHSRPTRLRAVYTALAAIVLVTLVAGTALAGSPTTVKPPTLAAAADSPRDPLVVQRERLAECQIDLQSATTKEQRDEARKCINTKNRSIAWLLAHPSPSPTVTVGPTTPPPTLPPTSAPPTTVAPTPTPTPSPTPTTDPGCTGQANPACTGVPAGWVPTTTRSGTWRITAPGTYSDVLVNGDIIVNALGVVLERVRVTGGGIINADGIRCYNGTILRQVEVIQGATHSNAGADGVIGPGGYIADRVKIDDRVEGFRVGAHGDQGCQTTTITNSFVHITPPQPCGDWHGDGIQVYDGPPLIARNVTLYLDEIGGCGGTAPYFQAGAEFGNAPPDIDGMLVRGGGYSFRLLMAGSVKNLHVVDGSWFYGPVDVICSALTAWSADVVRIDANWQTTAVVRTLPC